MLSKIAKTDKLLQELGVKQDSISFRPPWGRRFVVLSYLLSQMHKKLIICDVDSQDYEKTHTAEEIANQVINNRPRPYLLWNRHPACLSQAFLEMSNVPQLDHSGANASKQRAIAAKSEQSAPPQYHRVFAVAVAEEEYAPRFHKNTR